MKEIILSQELPKPIGPFSQAAKANGLVFTSGQLPINLETNELEIEDIKKATLLCLEAIEKLAIAAGVTKNEIVKATIFLNDINNYALVNEAYAEFFEGCMMPARTAYAVNALPLNSLIEIEAIISAE